MSKNAFNVKFSVRLMCQLALLVALEIVFNRFLSIRTPIVKIGFSFVPIVVCGAAFGPVWAAAVYVAADVLGTVFEGNVPLPGLTLSFAMMGFMFGMFLYSEDGFSLKSPVAWLRVAAPVVINQLALSLLANSYWLFSAGFGGGGTFLATVAARAVQTAILIPVQIAVIPILIPVVNILRRMGLLRQ
jgi:ECF transporter S component (folate family)